MDEHHPAHNSLLTTPSPRTTEGDTSLPPPRSTNRDTMVSVAESEASPIYSPIGGSALLPDSPHLNGRFASGRGSVSRSSSQAAPDSPQNGSVRERVEELEKGMDA